MKIFSFVISALLILAKVASALPNGFIAEVVTSTSAVTGIFAPNPSKNGKPMLLLIAKEGQVKVLEDPDESPDSRTILDLSDKMCTETERGLHSVTVHPDFMSAPYVYLYYTQFKDGCLADDSENGPWNVLTRFSMNNETLALDYDSRKEIWRGAPTHDAVHNGGGILFGNDGKIYLTTGDSGTQDNAQDLQTVHGKVICLNEDGSTPRDNPFVADNGYEAFDCRLSEGKVPAANITLTNAVCGEIYSNGLRNPFRVAVNPNVKDKTLFAISDVGARVWEELNYGGTDYSGKNYGYKEYEGPCIRHSDSDCPVPEDPTFVEPFHYYLHREDENGCVSGAAFVPEGVWPEEYTLLFGDYVFHEVYSLMEDPEHECRECAPPVSRFRNSTFYESIRYPGDSKNQAKIVDIFFGPYKDTQALYIVRFGIYDTVIRIRYTGIDNSPPLVVFSFDESKKYDVGDEVSFDGSKSTDPEGKTLVFKWFFGDGTESNEVSPIHVYAQPGEYTVTLFVEDDLKQVQQISKTIAVGDPPVVTIISPAENDQFSVGQVLTVVGEAYHANGTAFKESQLLWEVRKHHDDHYHPYLDPRNGNNIKLSPAPKPEDFYASTNSYLEIILYAKDENTGLTGKATRLVQPAMVEVGIDSYPFGLEVQVDDEPVTAYQTIISWKNHDLQLAAADQPPFMFLAWSDGSTKQQHSMLLNSSFPEITAIFCAKNNGPCTENFACCSKLCFEEVCVTELPPTGTPSAQPTFQPSSLDSSQSNHNRQWSTTASSVVIVIVAAVSFVLGAFVARFCLKHSTKRSDTLECSKFLESRFSHSAMDEEKPFSQQMGEDNDGSSDGSKPGNHTIVTAATTATSDLPGEPS